MEATALMIVASSTPMLESNAVTLDHRITAAKSRVNVMLAVVEEELRSFTYQKQKHSS